MKEIPNYEGRYLVSDDGMVFVRDRYGLYAMSLQREGRYVRLSNKGRVRNVLVARLVLEAFGRRPMPMHLDGNPSNNRLDNLCWDFESEEVCTRVSSSI